MSSSWSERAWTRSSSGRETSARSSGTPLPRCSRIDLAIGAAGVPRRRDGRGLRAAALLAVLALAAGLRVVGVRYGLPYPLLNPDEASVVPRAWEMAHGGGPNPGWFEYPTLQMDLLVPVQWLFGAPSYGAARVVAVLTGLAGVGATWTLGRYAYGTRAAVVGAIGVAVATTHVAYSRMAVTDVLLTLGVTVCLALAICGRLEWAGLAAGLATSAKYPGVLLAVPVLVAGWGRWRRLGRAAGLAAAGFALTSPYVLLDVGNAWEDVSRVTRLARAGWLGFEDDALAPLAFSARAWEALGPVLLVALAGAALALRRRTRTDLVLLSFAAAYWLQLMPLGAHFDRYLLPLVPVLAVLAGSVRALAPVAVVLLAVPLWWSVGDARDLTRADARVPAAAWLAAHVPAGDRVAADPSSPPLPGDDVVRLELPGPGRATDPRRDLAALARLGVRWVVVTGAVTDRVLAERDRYPREARFYDALAREASVAYATAGDGRRLGGPWVRVYRLSARA